MLKVNLLLDNPGDARSGYLNIDPFGEDDLRTKGNLHDLALVDAGEAGEIVAYDILDYFPAHIVDQILNSWLSKLAHGGKITIGVIDLKEVSRAVINNTITIEDANELLHGKQEKDWQFKKSVFTLQLLVEVLQNKGYHVLQKRIANYRAVVTAERP